MSVPSKDALIYIGFAPYSWARSKYIYLLTNSLIMKKKNVIFNQV